MVAKFMVVSILLFYQALKSEGSLRTRACENDKLTLKCLEDKSLKIISANYGRLNKNVCTSLFLQHKVCTSSTALDVVKTRCQGRNNCAVHASNVLFGDPCLWVKKYLEVEYTCEYGPKRVRSCEHLTLKMKCEDEKVLKIISANYGRTDKNFCSYSPTDNCTTPGALNIVKESCDGYTKCNIKASNKIFGDPCPWIGKYLEVEYDCI